MWQALRASIDAGASLGASLSELACSVTYSAAEQQLSIDCAQS